MIPPVSAPGPGAVGGPPTGPPLPSVGCPTVEPESDAFDALEVESVVGLSPDPVAGVAADPDPPSAAVVVPAVSPLPPVLAGGGEVVTVPEVLPVLVLAGCSSGVPTVAVKPLAVPAVTLTAITSESPFASATVTDVEPGAPATMTAL